MPSDAYEHTSMTSEARQRLRDVHALILQKGVPKSIAPPKAHTLSETIRVMAAITEREINRGKR